MFDVHSSLCLARATVCKYTIKIIFTFSLQIRRNVKLVVFNVLASIIMYSSLVLRMRLRITLTRMMDAQMSLPAAV